MNMTTYQQCYSPSSSPRGPTRYIQFPSIVNRGTLQQPPRQFPVEPVGPKRNLELDHNGPVLGLGSKAINIQRFLEPKAITASPVPSQITCSLPKPPARDRMYARQARAQAPGRPGSASVYQTKFGSMDSNLINKLVHHVSWTPTSRAAAEEVCLKFPQIEPPPTTLEKKPDQVRMTCQRYEATPMEWQRAVFWDFIQTRGSVHDDDLSEKTYSRPEKLLLKRQSKGMAEHPRSNATIIRKLVREDQLSSVFVRQCPGYSGFVPRTPTESELTKRPQHSYMVSTMKANYRELPEAEYRKQTFARKGPLSKTVTLTYPFNPYNKV